MLDIIAGSYPPEHVEAGYPVLWISGEYFEAWIKGWVKHELCESLAFVHGHLTSRADIDLAWERLYSWERLGESVIVPLLVCPDDMDFHCTVLVAEQISTQSEIKWARFGFTKDTELSHDVDWIPNVPVTSFCPSAFREAVSKLWVALNYERL